MMHLNHAAETFLARLADNLWPLTGDECEAVLLELRSHLLELQNLGPAHLQAALDDMGPPETLAAAFVDASVTPMRPAEPRLGRVLLPAAISNSRLADTHMRGVPRLFLGDLARDFRATLAATGDGLSSVCAFMVAGYTITAFLASIHEVMPERIATPPWLILAIRMAISIIGSAAAYRCILGRDSEIWRLDLPLLRYAFASMLLALVIMGPSQIILGIQLADLSETPAPYPFFRDPLLLFAWMTTSVVALRWQPWAISLLLDRPITAGASWSGTSGKGLALAAAWLITVLPPFVAHLGISVAMVQLAPARLTEFGLLICLVDALSVMTTVIAATILNSLAFRWAMREPIPAPRPFSSTEPSDAEMAETNLRFQRYLTEKWRRDRENSLGDSPLNR